MDTSKQYIKMCEKAEEIQSQKPGGSQGEFVYCEGEAYQEMDDRPLTLFIWLPRQDQLQKMADETFVIFWQEFLEYEYFKLPEYMKDIDGDSMEQLWLAFVMKEKYNKVWNSKEWIST